MHALIAILAILHIHGALAATIIKDAPTVYRDAKIAYKDAKAIVQAYEKLHPKKKVATR
jgi:hypothetical protein